MQPSSTKENLNFLWNHIDRSRLTDFRVANGKLEIRSLFEFFFFRSQQDEVKTFIYQILSEAIECLESKKWIYLSKISTSLFDIEAMYAVKFPVYYLAEKIKTHPDFEIDLTISVLADRILELRERYPDSLCRDGILRGMNDPKVLHWDESGPTEESGSEFL